MNAEDIVALSRQYTLYDWSAQSNANPIAVDRAEGVYFYTPDGKRYLDFNSQLMGVNIGHGDKRVIAAIARQAEQLAYISPFMAHEPRALLGQRLAADPARRHREGVLHARRRRGQRERHPHGPRGDRPPEDPRAVSLVSRVHQRRDHLDGRSAPMAERAGNPGRGARARSAPRAGPRPDSAEESLALPRGDHPARGAADHRGVHPRAGDRNQRHPHPTRRLPAGRARAVRPLRHRHDRGRDHVRIRPHRRMVRRRPLGRGAGHHHHGQGPHLELRAAWARSGCGRTSPSTSSTRCSTAG